MLRQYKSDLRQKTANEYCGPCDRCGGDDRFNFFIDTQRAWCRNDACGWKPDVIEYLREVKGMSFKEAAAIAGKETGVQLLTGTAKPKKERSPFRPEQLDPPEQWGNYAEALAAKSHANLMEGRAQKTHQWLETARGLKSRTIQENGLGWNPTDRYESRAAWGMEPGKTEKFILPAGLVIPTFTPTVTRIRIRREMTEKNRYHIVSGGKTTWSRYGKPTSTIMIVESDLDAMLINQELKIQCWAMTSSALNPTRSEFDEIMQAETIIDSLDADKAGIEAGKRLSKLFGKKLLRFPPISGKDPGDMHKAGIDLNEWYQAGMRHYQAA
jgi:DNA primase